MPYANLKGNFIIVLLSSFFSVCVWTLNPFDLSSSLPASRPSMNALLHSSRNSCSDRIVRFTKLIYINWLKIANNLNIRYLFVCLIWVRFGSADQFTMYRVGKLSNVDVDVVGVGIIWVKRSPEYYNKTKQKISI